MAKTQFSLIKKIKFGRANPPPSTSDNISFLHLVTLSSYASAYASPVLFINSDWHLLLLTTGQKLSQGQKFFLEIVSGVHNIEIRP